MEPLTWGFIGTLVGTVVGASASIITTHINARNSIKIQNDLENYKRQEIFREFQRDNYLKLQETFHKALRLVSLLHLEDIKKYKETGKWQQTILNSENDKNLMIALRDLSFYEERIESDQLRNEFKGLRKKISSVSRTSSQDESDAIMMDLMKNDFDRIMTDLGTELRKNY
ncbi:hypothetical protein ACG2LH_11620 [Zhouia sp. PK063]|uniref:hypothetical protein n=1 Tax=Zhouia sp. PK063 TaxID=3373602 RepID=UPI0037A5EBDF